MAPEGDSRAYFLTMDEIKEKVFEAQDNGATEVCMQGGMHPDIDGNFYVEIIKSVKEAVLACIHIVSHLLKFTTEQKHWESLF